MMDLLDDYLTGVRAHGALFCTTVSTPPWGLRFTEPAPLTLAAMLRGHAWIVPTEGDPVELRQGDIALIRTDLPYSVADHPASFPQVLVDGDDRCTLTADPAAPGRTWRQTGRTITTDDHPTDLLVTAGYRGGGDLCAPLLRTLPAFTVVHPEQGLASLLGLITDEADSDKPGQQVVLDRFLDLLLVRTLRSWFDRPDASPPTGYRALADPDIGHVLCRIHEEPARPWTVASLAGEAGMSRTTFARRFTALVGQPPLAYLTGWRMALAADQLRKPQATVAAVARAVGYTDGFAFSAAFKRLRGISPSAHRSETLPQPRDLPTTPPVG
ncbi:AraC family transcriptional regulator [Streptomyces olivoreticuli]|uniref:AraC family transcriptional regulator n=1 Tax=Streptomyces olivoreticuli TaxID=68246 RepID=UPI001F07C126|nr:AraC family transcriptional regulator [Streptomyces olivoreticuli]